MVAIQHWMKRALESRHKVIMTEFALFFAAAAKPEYAPFCDYWTSEKFTHGDDKPGSYVFEVREFGLFFLLLDWRDLT